MGRRSTENRLAALAGAALVFTVGALVTGCSQASERATDTYILSVTASGAVGAGGFDVTIRDEAAATDLAASVGATSPVTVEAAATIDFSAIQSIAVIVTGNDIPDTQTMTVTVTYTENSYVPAVTRTIDTTTRTNTTGLTGALEYRLALALPIN